ncbi:hypothetical protein Tco_1062502, partial [Tanacetum coccineum]
ILWSDEELEMIKTSLLYEQTLKYKAHIEKIYLSIKHVLDRFPEYFEDVTLDKVKLHCVTKPVVKSIKRSSARESCLDVEDLVIVALVNA